MNPLTQKIKLKGYTLTEFLTKINHSLRWYRTHEIPRAKSYDFLVGLIDELETK